MAGRKTLAPDGDQRAKSRSWLYMMLFLPYGVPSGFVSVALAYGLAQAHVPTVAIADRGLCLDLSGLAPRVLACRGARGSHPGLDSDDRG